MSDKNPLSSKDLKSVKLSKAKTQEQKAEMKLSFKCEKCGKIQPWPNCCGQPMELQGNNLVCFDKTCNTKASVPVCHGKMKPNIAKA